MNIFNFLYPNKQPFYRVIALPIFIKTRPWWLWKWPGIRPESTCHALVSDPRFLQTWCGAYTVEQSEVAENRDFKYLLFVLLTNCCLKNRIGSWMERNFLQKWNKRFWKSPISFYEIFAA